MSNDVVPHSQIKSLYGGIELDDEKKPQKDKKKDTEKKTKKQDKKIEQPKPKPPKTIEEALDLINISDLATIIATNKVRFCKCTFGLAEGCGKFFEFQDSNRCG
ncbi:hypothetical protein ACJJTC_015186 [Scirpophaga incertulas]